MRTKVDARALVAVVALLGAGAQPARAAEGNVHQVYITASSPLEGVRWYTQHMKCQPIADRTDTANCGRVELVFLVQPTQGGTQGSGVNHISFSFPDVPAKMRELEKVGVRGAGVRLQRFPDGALFQDVPGLFKLGFIFDPWGTRIELVEDDLKQAGFEIAVKDVAFVTRPEHQTSADRTAGMAASGVSSMR